MPHANSDRQEMTQRGGEPSKYKVDAKRDEPGFATAGYPQDMKPAKKIVPDPSADRFYCFLSRPLFEIMSSVDSRSVISSSSSFSHSVVGKQRVIVTTLRGGN